MHRYHDVGPCPDNAPRAHSYLRDRDLRWRWDLGGELYRSSVQTAPAFRRGQTGLAPGHGNVAKRRPATSVAKVWSAMTAVAWQRLSTEPETRPAQRPGSMR